MYCKFEKKKKKKSQASFVSVIQIYVDLSAYNVNCEAEMAEGLPPCRLTSASILLSEDPRLSAGLYPLVWWGRSLG